MLIHRFAWHLNSNPLLEFGNGPEPAEPVNERTAGPSLL
jgi:hypothetical protein